MNVIKSYRKCVRCGNWYHGRKKVCAECATELKEKWINPDSLAGEVLDVWRKVGKTFLSPWTGGD